MPPSTGYEYLDSLQLLLALAHANQVLPLPASAAVGAAANQVLPLKVMPFCHFRCPTILSGASSASAPSAPSGATRFSSRWRCPYYGLGLQWQ